LILLHLSLGARVAGDLLSFMPMRVWGGLFNALAILFFLGLVFFLLLRGKRETSATTGLAV
jgi:hypothetical protein